MGKKANSNNLIKMQEMLMRQMERLDDNELMKSDPQTEISRGNALSQSACTFLKSINVGIRIIEVANKYETQKDKLTKELGVVDEK